MTEVNKGMLTRWLNYLYDRTNAKEMVATLVLEINDPEFTREQFIGGKELYLKYHVPMVYPLEPCSIEIENRQLDTTRAR